MAQNATNRINEPGFKITNVIRENPIPAAMLGVSLGWLFWSARQQRTFNATSRYAGQQLQRGESDVSTGEYVEDTQLTDAFVEPQGSYEAMERVNQRAGQIADKMKATGSKLGARAKNAAGKVAETTRNGGRRVQEQFFESPLAVGTATLAAGLAAGLVVPATRRETELVGDVRDRLVDRVRNVASVTADKAQYATGRAMDEVGAGRGAV